jgi:hypothetical protein
VKLKIDKSVIQKWLHLQWFIILQTYLEMSFSFSYLQGFQHQLLFVAIIVVVTIRHKVTRAWKNVKGEKAANKMHV